MPAVELTDIRKSFGNLEIIKGVNLAIEAGEFVVFVGPSGCGKSTLLRMIAGLEDISAGTLSIGGTVVNDVDPSRRGIAMVFQSYALYPHMSVRENMGFALKFAGMDKADIARRVDDAAAILGLEPLMERKPKALSGGQRQRVAIGRAIVRHPEVFLFDEPLSNLDAELRVHMRVEIAKLHKRLSSTVIYVTHDQVEAMTLADKIVVLRSGEVEQIGRPLDLYDDPANLFVAGFIGSPKMNFLKARVAALDAGRALVELVNQSALRLDLPAAGGSVKVGDQLTLGIRPEHFVGAGEGDADLAVSVDVTEHLGSTSYVYADVGPGERVIIERGEGRGVAVRDKLVVGLPAGRCFLFDAAGRRVR